MRIRPALGLCAMICVPTFPLAADEDLVAKRRTKYATAAAQQALDRYVAEIAEIERVAAKRKTQARRRLAESLRQTRRAEAESGARYRGMLGTFHDQDGRIPYVLLSVPNGSNVYDERMRAAMNGKYEVSEPLYRFEARGHVKIPVQGVYRLETGRGYGKFQLNGMNYVLTQRRAGQPPVAEVKLDQGVYEVYLDVYNNGGQLLSSLVRISDANNGQELPIFVYESDLDKFLNDLSLGVELTETSGWKRKKHRMK